MKHWYYFVVAKQKAFHEGAKLAKTHFFKAVDFALTKLSLVPIQKKNYNICRDQFNLANLNLSKYILSILWNAFTSSNS